MTSEPDLDLEVLIPFWGDRTLLLDALGSLIGQRDARWRAVVIDDADPDPGIGDLVRSLGDERVSYQRNPVNLGVAGNFEHCRRLATGDLTVFLGADDLLLPDYVGTIRALASQFPTAAIYETGVVVIDGAGSPTSPVGDRVKRALMPHRPGPSTLGGERLAASLIRGNWLYWPSLAIRREALVGHPFRTEYPINLDLALILDIVADGGTLAIDPRVAFAYRRHTASASSLAIDDGSRFVTDREFYRDTAARMLAKGLPRAARAARVRLTSRLHGLTLLPGAAASGDRSAVRALIEHVVAR